MYGAIPKLIFSLNTSIILNDNKNDIISSTIKANINPCLPYNFDKQNMVNNVNNIIIVNNNSFMFPPSYSIILYHKKLKIQIIFVSYS